MTVAYARRHVHIDKTPDGIQYKATSPTDLGICARDAQQALDGVSPYIPEIPYLEPTGPLGRWPLGWPGSSQAAGRRQGAPARARLQ